MQKRSFQQELAYDCRKQRKITRIFTLCLITLLLCAAHTLQSSGKPERPGTIPETAFYLVKHSLWILDHAGVRKVWYKNGRLKAAGAYRKKRREGKWLFYYPNGRKKAQGSYSNGIKAGLWSHYDTEGNVEKEGNYKKGRKQGPWKGYYKNGQVFYQGFFRNNKADGKWIYFYRDGSFFQEGHFQRDVRVGKWRICVHPRGPCSVELY